MRKIGHCKLGVYIPLVGVCQFPLSGRSSKQTTWTCLPSFIPLWILRPRQTPTTHLLPPSHNLSQTNMKVNLTWAQASRLNSSMMFQSSCLLPKKEGNKKKGKLSVKGVSTRWGSQGGNEGFPGRTVLLSFWSGYNVTCMWASVSFCVWLFVSLWIIWFSFLLVFVGGSWRTWCVVLSGPKMQRLGHALK